MMNRNMQRSIIIAALAYLLLFVLIDTFASIPMMGFIVLGIIIPYIFAIVIAAPLLKRQKLHWKLIPLLAVILACTYETLIWFNMPKEHLEMPLFILSALSFAVVLLKTNLPLLPNVLAHFILIRTTFLHTLNHFVFDLLDISLMLEKPGAVYFFNYWETKVLLLILLLYMVISQRNTGCSESLRRI
jgi:hypothetical protein